MNVKIVYFSGTGSSKKVATTIFESFKKRKNPCEIMNITETNPSEITDQDLLIIVSPVHAFRLVVIVEKWLKGLPKTEAPKNAAVISVSAGGEVTPNTACRNKAKKILLKKRYNIVYEDMFMMPSNFGVPSTKDDIKEMNRLLPLRVEKMVSDISSGYKKILKPQFQDGIIASLGKAEHFGARLFGKMLKSNNSCTMCGLCSTNCPSRNIKIKDSKLKFGFNCIWCMKCIYSCPQNSISPRILKSVVLKDGFIDYSKWDMP